MPLEPEKVVRCFEGEQRKYLHASASTDCEMQFSVFLPKAALSREAAQSRDTAQSREAAQSGEKVPALIFLSGLTCTDENFSTKAGAQRYAAEHGVALVMPDTSPRGVGLPGEDENWDFGSGAGFYVDATEEPWSRHYKMYSYITQELHQLLLAELPIDRQRIGLFGHSMGGHGALTLGIRHPELYKSVSAFSPICSPLRCGWGKKALAGYLGSDEKVWREHDATALLEDRGYDRPLLVDQGEADDFLVEQLKPELLEQACQASKTELNLRRRPGYDHGYYFISSFVGEHIAWHAERLA